jgi:hypothetical protein
VHRRARARRAIAEAPSKYTTPKAKGVIQSEGPGAAKNTAIVPPISA